MSERISDQELADVRRGLQMACEPDPQAMAAEKERLVAAESAGAGARLKTYLGLVGPGYMQSAMTLGGGTAASSLFAGALFGYSLLWVAPLSMVLGIVMLAAVSWQTLSTGMRPLQAMKRYAGAPFAWGWAIGAIVSSIIWHFPQYSLAAACIVDMGIVFGIDLPPQLMGFIVLAWAIAISFLYGATPNAVRWYERLLKYMVWGVVLCFAMVVIKTGISDWGALFRGFIPSLPEDRNGVASVTLVLSGLSAAVGINMVFLYPYSLLARGWGREHRRLSRFDLLASMFLPYFFATTLMVIATANTLHGDPNLSTELTAGQAAGALRDTLGETFGRVIFDIGVLGMALSTITLHMLTVGFVCAELFGWPVGSWKYRFATLVPAIGVFGPVFWSANAVWLAVPTSILCGFLLPVAYVGFIILQRKRGYLGDDMPSGSKGVAWLASMIFITLFMVAFLGWYAITKGPGWLEKLGG